MVVMSDLSGPGVKPEESGYLTGYPLEGLGKYVLARTWAAPEMPRPGCVWTHSLIIDNADLATLISADGLQLAFRRPSDTSAKSEYAEPASFVDMPRSPTVVPRGRMRSILAALYGAPAQAVVAEIEQAKEDEQLVTAIWMQQWPRLRRAFGFCTLAGMDRSGKGVLLDLQFVRSVDRQILAKFPNAVTPTTMLEQPALEPLVTDLEGERGTQIREFLRRTGGDVDGGRRAMLPLCRLYSSLFTSERPNLPAAVNALGSLDSFGTRQARSVRTLIAGKAIEQVNDIDDAVFDFVVETLERGTQANSQPFASARIGMALWHRSPTRFVEAIAAGGVVGKASADALDAIAAPDLVRGLRDNPQLADCIVSARPEMLEREDFWSIPDIDESLAAGVDAARAGRVAAVLLIAGKAELAPLIIERADPGELAAALDAADSGPVLNAWLRTLALDPGKTAAVLNSAQILRRSVVVGLARASNPDAVPNDLGEDPWIIAISATHKKNTVQADEDYVAAFLLSRALGFRSRSQAELIRFSYTTLHRAFEQRRMPADTERMATWRLDWGGWFNQDNCLRLRDTVVNRFVSRHLDPEIFGRLTDDGPLAIALIDEAARTSRGRRYLEEVRKRLKDVEGKGIRVRVKYIADKIK